MPSGPGITGVLQRGAALQDVEQGLPRSDTGKNMGVRHAEIGVEKKDAPAEPGESDREVDARGGLADTPLAAGHGHHAGGAHGGGEPLANDGDGVAFDEEPATGFGGAADRGRCDPEKQRSFAR